MTAPGAEEPYADPPPYPGQTPPSPPPPPPPSYDPYDPYDPNGSVEHGYAYGSAYVPEPLGGQLPAQSDPGAAFGVPSPGDAWGDRGAEQQAHSWAGPPPQAPARDDAHPAPRTGPAHAAPAAPVRTGSPIIPPGIQPAALTAVLGLLTAGGAALGKPLLAVVLVLLEAVTAAGWFRLNGMWPARQGIALAFLAGVTADVALLAASGGHNAEVLLGTLGGWLLLVLVLQLRHHGSADERLSSLTATSASTLLTVVAAGWLATAESGAGTDPVVVGAIAVAAATLVRAVRVPGGDVVSLVLTVLAALATGLATGPATGLPTGHAVVLAAVCGVCAAVGLRVASYDFPSRFVHFTAGVALPLTAAAPAAYLLGNAFS